MKNKPEVKMIQFIGGNWGLFVNGYLIDEGSKEKIIARAKSFLKLCDRQSRG